MTAPLSEDLRSRLVRAVEMGSSARQAAARFEVSALADMAIEPLSGFAAQWAGSA